MKKIFSFHFYFIPCFEVLFAVQWKHSLWNILTKSSAVCNEIESIIIKWRMLCRSKQEKEGAIKTNKWKYGTIHIWKYDTKYIKNLLESWRKTTM